MLTGLLGLMGAGCGLFENKDETTGSQIEVDEPGRVVAIVNGMPVMEIDFHWAIHQSRGAIAQRDGLSGDEERTQLLRTEGMNSLIEGALLLQEAKKRDIDATAAEIATAIQNTPSDGGDRRFIDANGRFDQAAYQSFLTAAKISESQHQRLVRKDIRRQKTLDQLQQAVSISEEDVWSFYQQGGIIHPDFGQPYLGPRQYRYSFIRVPIHLFDTAGSTTQARRKARTEAENLYSAWRRMGQPPHSQLRTLNANLSPLTTGGGPQTHATFRPRPELGELSEDYIEQLQSGQNLLQPQFYSVIYLQAVELEFPQIMDGHCTDALNLYDYDTPGTLLESVEWVDDAWCVVHIDEIHQPTRQDFESADRIELGFPKNETSGQSVSLTAPEFREWARSSLAIQSTEAWLNDQVAAATVQQVYTPGN